MRKSALSFAIGFSFTWSAIALAQVATTTCAAGQLDATFGAPGTGYVQISPTLNSFGSVITSEGQGLDATGASFTLSEAAVDASGIGIPDLVKVKVNGARDNTFGGFGSIVPEQPFAGGSNAAFATDSDGNFLVAMNTGDAANVVVSRYSPAGVLDLTYGSAGVATVPINLVAGPWAIRTAADGGLLIATRGRPPTATAGFVPVVVKLTQPGALDTTFGLGGYSFFYNKAFGPKGSATDLIVQADGTILVGGRVGDNSTYNRFFVARLLANGALDTTFGTGGMQVVGFGTVLAYGRKLAVQSNGKIVLVGGIQQSPTSTALLDTGVIRLNPNGSLDTSFHATGKERLVGGGGAFGVALQNNNKILITSQQWTDATQSLVVATVERLTAGGQPDATFGASGNGIANLPIAGYAQSGATNVTYVPGGKILAHLLGYDASGANFVDYLVRLDSGVGIGCH